MSWDPIYQFRGSVETIEDLPERGKDGDIYIIKRDEGYHTVLNVPYVWHLNGWYQMALEQEEKEEEKDEVCTLILN